MMTKLENIYVPRFVEIKEIIQETPDIKTFKVDYKLQHKPGQFVQVYVFGIGEIPLSIPVAPSNKLEFCVKKVGRVTSAMHELVVGDKIGVRGPYGNSFPMDDMKGHDILLVGGGIGLPPLRSVIEVIIGNLKSYGYVQLLYGARSPKDIVYKELLKKWEEKIDVRLTVDVGDESWKGHVGVVTTLFDQIKVDSADAYALIVGPPIMIKFSIKGLLERGFREDRIVVSLERMMKCGVGTCGHCNIGPYYVCKDGPIFTYSQIKDLPEAL